MTLPSIVGLVGFPGSGREMFADVLVKEADYARAAFSDAAEREGATWLGLTVEDLRADGFDAMVTRRMIERRERFPGYWRGYLSAVLKMPKRSDEEFGHFVVPAVACAEDAEYLQGLGGEIVRVVKDGRLDPETRADGVIHEIAYDYYVDGRGDDHLRAQARDLLRRWAED